MSHHEPAKAFIDNYIRLLNESADIGEFQKILEMKVRAQRGIFLFIFIFFLGGGHVKFRLG